MGMFVVGVVAINFGLGVVLVLGRRYGRYFWWLIGAQALVVSAGVTVLASRGGFSAGWRSVFQSGAAFMVCVVGPVGMLTACASYWALRRVAQPGERPTGWHEPR